MDIVTAQQMREIDRLAIEKYQVPSLTLMENAGLGAVKILRQKFPHLSSKKIVVVTGRGNNAGDGFVVARLLRGSVRSMDVLLLTNLDEIRGDALVELCRYQEEGGKFFGFSESSSLLNEADIIVDAIFGTGLSKEVTGVFAEAIQKINQQRPKSFVYALDIPSGLSADAGKALGVAVKADLTATMGFPKWGLIQPEAYDFVGDLEVIDIGIPPSVLQDLNLPDEKGEWITSEEIRTFFKPRPRSSHKGNSGHVLLIGGSETKPGAILMAGRAALRAGAGLVTVALPDRAFRKFPKNFLELMYEPLPSTSSGTLSRRGIKRLLSIMEEKDAIGLGPGMGVNTDTARIIEGVLRESQVPLVFDADALNSLSENRGVLEMIGRMKRKVILTPHPGEMARLQRTTIAKVQKNRPETARQFSKKYRLFLALKGYRTIMSTPDGKIFWNSTGNPGMATAGMGDVLTGLLTSLLAQGMELLPALLAGVYLHGRAGDRVAASLGDRGLMAGDLIEEIPLTIKELFFSPTS